MRQLTRMFEEQQNEIRWEDGTIIIPDPAALERILPDVLQNVQVLLLPKAIEQLWVS